MPIITLNVDINITRYVPHRPDYVSGHPDTAEEGWPAEVEFDVLHNGHDITDLLDVEAYDACEAMALEMAEGGQ